MRETKIIGYNLENKSMSIDSILTKLKDEKLESFDLESHPQTGQCKVLLIILTFHKPLCNPTHVSIVMWGVTMID